MYESPAPVSVRVQQGEYLAQMFTNDGGGQRRELSLGFAALRKREMIQLCKLEGIELSEDIINGPFSADRIAQYLDGLWQEGRFSRASTYDTMDLGQLLAEAQKRDVNITGMNPAEIRVWFKALDKMDATPSESGPATASAPEGDQGSGPADQESTVTPIKRGPGRPTTKNK